MVHRSICIMLILGTFLNPFLCWQLVNAASPADHSYTLEQIVELALKHNPTVARAEGAVDHSRSQQVAAEAYLNPSISGTAGHGAIRDPSTGVSIIERTITIEQPLEWSAKRAARQRAAQVGVAGAHASLAETQLNVIADVKAAFYQVLLAQREAELAIQNLKTVEATADVVKAKVSSGEAAQFVTIKANVEIQKARKNVAQAQNALLVARVALDTLTAKQLGQQFVVRGDFQAYRSGLDLNALLQQSSTQHPAIKRHQKSLEQAKEQVTLERESQIPNVSVQAQYHREAGDESWTAGLSVPLPLWYRRQGEIGMALGTQRQAAAEAEKVRNELERAITQFYREAETAHEQIDVFEKGLLNQAKEAMDIARFSFEQGAANLLDVLDAQRVYQQTLVEYTRARFELSVAMVRLEWATGGLQ